VSFVDRIRACAVFDPALYIPFIVGGVRVGLINPEFADRLSVFNEVYMVAPDSMTLSPRLSDFDARTAAVDATLRMLAEQGLISGWRDEPFPVAISPAGPILLNMERAAVPLFGIRAYGVHLNGVVREAGTLKMWVGRRSMHRPRSPGKLDQLVAGGQPAGLSLRDNLAKECGEEASIPPALAAQAVSTGAVSYVTESEEGLRRDVLYVYDLELPPDFEPRNTDGEIDAFYLWPIQRVIETVRDTADFKFNCSLVVIDFLIRHGLIEPDHPDYFTLIHGLRSGVEEVP